MQSYAFFLFQLYCYSILHESLLQLYWNKLDVALVNLQTNPASWRHLETVLHGFLAVAEVVPMEEDRFLPNLLAGLKALPLNQLDVRVAGTVLDTVGEQFLTFVVPLESSIVQSVF